MTNEELIKALRCCIVDFNSTQSRLCNECPYRIYADGKKACENKAKRDAADALEAADEKIADYTAAIDALDDSNDAYIKENERLKKRIAELEAQMPKEGVWKEQELAPKNYRFCTQCGFANKRKSKWNHCPNCGARMKKGERNEPEGS